jgi:hypothetical protein
MSITNYGELKSAIANWAERDDLTSRIPEFVALAQDRIAMDLRVRAMETSADVTISAQTAALPTGFLGVRRFVLDNDASRLTYLNPEQFWMRGIARTEGTPKAFTIEGENFVFGPYPASGSHTGKLFYWARFTDLSADEDTNWLFSNARGMLLYGSLMELAMYLEDDEAAARWGRLYEDSKARVMKSDRRDRFPVGASVRSEVPTP